MARPTVVLDGFAAVAEPKRRRILEVLGSRRLPVTQLVDELHWPQPTVSKHLAVLRTVGLVQVERQQRQRVYSMNAAPLKTIHEWTAHFEQFWPTVYRASRPVPRPKPSPPAKRRNLQRENHHEQHYRPTRR